MLNKFVISTLAMAVLAACGSSGSSDQLEPLANSSTTTPAKPATPTTPTPPAKPATPTTPTTPTKPTTPTTPTTPTKPTTPTTPTTPTKPTTPTTPTTSTYNGTALIAQDRNGANVPVSKLGSNSLDSVVIDGTTVKLTQPGISAGTFTTISSNTKETIASGRYLSHMRFGTYRDFNANNTGANPSYAFAVGSVTPAADVPKTGIVKYTGLSTNSPIGGGSFMTGTSTFNVDFGKKTIAGTIHAASYNIPVAGKINGSAFSGEKNGINMSGHFYGPKAAELGGVYNGTVIDGSQVTNHIGSFGAKR